MRSIVQITNGVTGIVDKVQTLLVYWEKKYKHMWDQDKDAYIRYGEHLLWTKTHQACMLCRDMKFLAALKLQCHALLTPAACVQSEAALQQVVMEFCNKVVMTAYSVFWPVLQAL